jgi:hypothetical protein
VADPPKDEGVWFAAEFGLAEEGDVEEARDVVRPEVGALWFSGCDLERQADNVSLRRLELCENCVGVWYLVDQ